MRWLTRAGTIAALALAAPIGLPPLPASAQPARTALADQLARLAKQTDGTVGVAVQRVGRGRMITLNEGVTFPMASTFKIAVAAAILARIDKGEMQLDRMIAVNPRIVMNSAGIAEQTPHPGVSLSVHNLLELMLTRSDNTATDVLTAEAGGPAAVTAWLRKQGITGQRVDGDTAGLLYRALEVTPGTGTATFRETVEAAYAADPAKRASNMARTPNAAFNADPRDSSTPEAMAALLLRLRSGKALSAASTKTLIEIMERCHTGDARLKGLLPLGTVVAHKTGTVRSVANDVGLVTLPDGDQFVIAVYIKGDTKGSVVQDRTIAEIARTAYDYYALGGD